MEPECSRNNAAINPVKSQRSIPEVEKRANDSWGDQCLEN
jgi:hypothetical protein